MALAGHCAQIMDFSINSARAIPLISNTVPVDLKSSQTTDGGEATPVLIA